MWVSICSLTSGPTNISSDQACTCFQDREQVIGRWSANFQAFLLYSFARAAETKQHRLDSLTNRNVLSHGSESRSSRSGGLPGWFLVRAVRKDLWQASLLCSWMVIVSLHLHVFPRYVSVSKFPLHTEPGPVVLLRAQP